MIDQMKTPPVRTPRLATAGMIAAALACGLIPTSEAAEKPRVDSSTLTGKVMCGYQGWFNTPGDGTGMDWRHYRNPKTGKFEPGHAGIEFWPDMTEFAPHERFDTPFRHADGRVAQVFSPAVPDTVARHFRWMREYGIDGVFVQRFATEVTTGEGRAETPKSRTINRVLDNCRAGAKTHGRTYAVMYDLTGMEPERIARIKDDWRYLVKEKGILKDAAYQRHAGRPVVTLWGAGFKDRRAYGPKEVGDLVSFLKNDSECGGLTVMLGTSTYWRVTNGRPFTATRTSSRHGSSGAIETSRRPAPTPPPAPRRIASGARTMARISCRWCSPVSRGRT
jgi:hypothetical protein